MHSMGYSLYALVAKESVIRVLQAGTGIRPVELTQGLWLLPLSEALRPSRSDTEARPFGTVFWCLTSEVESLARRASAAGLVAYLEAEIFGGDGTQAVVAWRDGNVCLGPVITDLWMQDRSDSAQWPFNRVLRELGVSRRDAFDEFDAAKLYRHRSTEEWANPAPG